MRNEAPFTFMDRAVTLRFFEEDPVEVTVYLGDLLEEKIQRAVGHYEEKHTLEEDVENLRTVLGDGTEAVLRRAEVLDRLAVLELLSYAVRTIREEEGKKLTAPAAG